MTKQGAPRPQETRKMNSTSPKTRKGATARNNRHQIPKRVGHAPPKPGKTEEKTKAYPSKKEGKAPTTTPSTTNQTPHSRANKQPTKESLAHTASKGEKYRPRPQPSQRQPKIIIEQPTTMAKVPNQSRENPMKLTIRATKYTNQVLTHIGKT